MKKRVVFLMYNLRPAHVIGYNCLVNHYPIEMIAVITRPDPRYTQWLPGHAFEKFNFSCVQMKTKRLWSVDTPLQIWRMLAQARPDMLVFPGYLELPLLSALLWGRCHSVKMILGFESTVLDKPRYQLLEWIKFKLVNSFHRAFVNGERSRSYLNSLGFHNNDIVTVSQTVDNDFFIKESGLVRGERARWRAMLNLPDHYFLYVGRLESAKNVVGLVETYGLLCRQNRDNGCGLVIVGNGPEETRIRKLVKQQGLYNVHLVGFKPMEQLAPYYALADCFVIASICDPWPMVVHEAMACGLPILISERCGSAAELVRPGINGFQFNPEDHEALAGLMAGIASGQADLKRMGQASSDRIRDFTPERYAERLAQALEL